MEIDIHEEPVLVLIHSPVFGELTWHPTAELLGAHGRPTVTPSLRGVLEGPPPYYPRLVSAVAEAVDRRHAGRSVVLVGHSGAGPLLPAVSNGLAGTALGVVFVDAILPHAGQSWLDAAPEPLEAQVRDLATEGRLPPWDQWFPPGTLEGLVPDEATRTRFCGDLPRPPLSYFAERAPADQGVTPARSAFLRLSDAYEQQAAEAERRGWRVARRRAHHLAILTSPAEVCAALQDLTTELTSSRPLH
ncbi:alpha/beta fold hydrolase [Streptomyces sp. NL15-2K]|uniref:alpha/beta fold hydrolase n=1 Tax=Streptomyces sp. NL15-2K TaxID=376149 RepID=UPI000FF9DAA1|nr:MULTISPECIES: alpha/beta fold hydrolase [Actinomycetes]WKX10495.1 alpha/beta hydrolase [Kutzneria buriramensis]GCB47971.1 hypothetical protein SNL152K_5293 [Streptomyces sp. NL15-2K]